MRKFLVVSVVVVVLAAFVGTLLFLWSKSGADPDIFETEQLAKRDIIQKTVATGAITPRHEVDIKPRVSGILEDLFVEPGAMVDKGARLARIRVVPDVVRLNDAEANVSAARISFDNAKQELARYDKLRTVVSETEYNRQMLEFELGKQKLSAAESHLRLVREGAAKTGAASNVVTSTVSGMVIDVPLKEGASVIETNTFNAGTTIATIADMSDMIFTGWVDEAEVGKLREGMKLDIKVGALEDRSFTGKLEFIAPKSTTNNGAIQFEVRAAVEQQAGLFLRAGYSANADIVLDRRQGVMALNERALQFEDEKVFVEVENGPQSYEKRFVETGLSDGIHIEVVEGLGADEKVKVPKT